MRSIHLQPPPGKELLNKLRSATVASGELVGEPDHEARVEILLDAADEGIGEKLKEFAAQQAAGERLNAVAEAYFRRHPRSFDDPWPSAVESDKDLRTFFSTTSDTERPDLISKKAKELLSIDIVAHQVEIAVSSRASIAQRASSSNLPAAAK